MAGAGYRDWVAGDVPTATQFDQYLQEQTVMRFSSEAARDSALATVLSDGLCAFVTGSGRLYVYAGAVWNIVHEPRQTLNLTAVTQSGSVACTTSRAWYQRSYGVWRMQIAVTITGTGTTNNAVTVPTSITLPDAADVGGSWTFIDVSDSNRVYGGVVIPLTTVTMGLLTCDATNPGQLGVVPNIPLSSGDLLRITAQGAT